MSLIYFHRFLIFCAILFSVYLAWNSFTVWSDLGDTSSLVLAILSCVAAVGLSLYLRTVKLPQQKTRPPDEGD